MVFSVFLIYAFHEFYEAMVKKHIMMVLPQYGLVQLLEYFILPLFVTEMYYGRSDYEEVF